MKRKLLTVLALMAFVLMGFVSSHQPAPAFTNLKVLPKNISNQQLDKVMDEFKDALGVKCSFCHVHKKVHQRYSHCHATFSQNPKGPKRVDP